MPDKHLSYVAIGLLVITAFFPAVSHGSDLKALPPETRSFESPTGAYVLEIRAVDGWSQPSAGAELFRVDSADRSSRWFKVLPHRFGPGLAFVSDEGRVVLLDEWMKTPSEHAVVVVSTTGETVARHSMSEIGNAAGVATSVLVSKATVGPWMSAPPHFQPARDALEVEVAGVRLEINLRSGRISNAE